MKIFKNLSLFLLILLMGVGSKNSFAQNCVPAHISFELVKNSSDVFEVYAISDKEYAYPLNLVSSSVVIGITFPTGYSWTGGAGSFLNLNGSYGNGTWVLQDLDIAPSCVPGTDYVYASMISPHFMAFNTANVPLLLFTFELPDPGVEPCVGDIALLENTDLYVTSGGCDGSTSAANFIAISGEGLGACNNYAGNVNNGGINCDLSGPTPIELLNFRATAKKQYSQLNWTTTSETNNKGFEVQRSKNGTDWQKVGWVDGNGTTSRRMDFEFRDQLPFPGINYYRLKQYDFSGSWEFSPIRSVSFDDSFDKITAYPNPTSRLLNFSLPEFSADQIEVKVLNVNKQIVYQQLIENNESLSHQLDFTDLPTGVYVLKVRYNNREEMVPFVLALE